MAVVISGWIASNAAAAEIQAAFKEQLGVDSFTTTDLRHWIEREVKRIVLQYRREQRDLANPIDETDPLI